MKLLPGIAQKIQRMVDGQEIPSGRLQQPVVLKMVEDGAIQVRNVSKTRRMYFVRNVENLNNYLFAEFGISNLARYIQEIANPNLTRSGAVEIASNSKIKNIRTFKGFLVNCYQPVKVRLDTNETVIHPAEGTFTFIYDFDLFSIPENITIVGIENPENFRYIQEQKGLFKNIIPLFVSRYPHSNDLVKWLKKIPNNYLHFGDFDFAGINIFLNEFKKHIGEKAEFFIPDEIEKMIKEKGNANIYNTQMYKAPDIDKINDENLVALIKIIHKYKKGLEQEYLIHTDSDKII